MAKTTDPVLGAKIVKVRKMTEEELEAEGWDDCGRKIATALVLSTGAVIYASSDDEGNGPGTIFGKRGKSSFYVMPAK
jgi:hypothetical protein